MKTSIAATLSIVGVLASGAGAFAVNSYVLDSSSDTAFTAPVEIAAPAPVEVAPAVVAQSGSQTENQVVDQAKTEPATSSTVDRKVTAKTPETTTTIPSTQPRLNAAQTDSAVTTTYNVGDSGRVTLELDNGSLRVVSVTPNANWTAKLPEYDDGEIEVEFYSGSLEVEFKARVTNGQIAVYVESEDESRDDRYEEDDHHDDDHDERDDD